VERIYITGIRGMLGKAALPLFEKRYEIFPADRSEPDVCDHRLIIEDICRVGPRFVLHLAALTDVDRCETHPDEAFRVNALGTRNVALACQRSGAEMIYISTGMVYNGRKETPYVEFDSPDPANLYARSKYAGELAVRELLTRYFLFYSCWLFGGGADDKKFVAKIIERARKAPELKVVSDTYGSPTYTVDLARAIFGFIETGLYGKYHCVNTGCVNRLEMSAEILKAAGIEGCTLVPVSSAEFPLPAPRPRMEAMRNYHFELRGFEPMRPWREALAEYIRENY